MPTTPEREKWLDLAAFFVVIAVAAFILAITSGIAYVVVHFARKWW